MSYVFVLARPMTWMAKSNPNMELASNTIYTRNHYVDNGLALQHATMCVSSKYIVPAPVRNCPSLFYVKCNILYPKYNFCVNFYKINNC